MAEKKSGKEDFETAVYALGLKLIEDYTTGNCRDRNKTIDAIIEIFKMSVAKPEKLFFVPPTMKGVKQRSEDNV